MQEDSHTNLLLDIELLYSTENLLMIAERRDYERYLFV